MVEGFVCFAYIEDLGYRFRVFDGWFWCFGRVGVFLKGYMRLGGRLFCYTSDNL